MTRPCRAAVAGALCLVALSSTAPAAHAHGETNPQIRTVVDQAPSTPGVEVEIVASAATALRLTNPTPDDVEVLASNGEPFLRIGADGVDANANSRDFYASGNPDGVARIPRSADLDAPPRWERVSDEPSWTWFDHRLHPATPKIPPEVLEGERTVTLANWSVPLRIGGEPAQVEGHVEFRPITGKVVPELTAPPPRDSGVNLAVLPGPAPALFLQSRSPETIVVVGASGEPFARVTPSGVEVNLHSPTYHASQLVSGQRVLAVEDAEAAPRWRRIASAPSFSWFDPRPRYEPEQPPDDVVASDEPTELLAWTVPLRVGERLVEAQGATSWVPSGSLPGAEPPPGLGAATIAAIAVGALAVVAVALAFAWRTRRRASGRQRSTAAR